MSLFKIFKGPEEELNLIQPHEGYAYFCENTGNMFIDISNEVGSRVQVNAYAADVLHKVDEEGNWTEIDVDDIFLKDMIAAVTQGGTGHGELTVNALFIGNGTDPVKMVNIEAGSLVVGDAENGVTGLKGTGLIVALAEGAPEFKSIEETREILDVYNKEEVDTRVDNATSKPYYITLTAADWTGSEAEGYTQTAAITDLTCGINGDTPPVITCITNRDEYSYIDTAEATIATGITFTAYKLPTTDMELVVIDVK